jgi:hypothetical protein
MLGGFSFDTRESSCYTREMNWIFDHSHNDTVRYTLGKPAIGKGKKNLVCFGINPSTARPDDLDNTLKSVERIAKRSGYDGWIMLNVYPQRATDPNDLHTEFDKKIHKNNIEHIARVLTEYNATILAAWGTLINKRPYLKECLQDIHGVSKQSKRKWVRIGAISKDGHPHHPLYLSNAEMPTSFNINAYIKNL